MHVQSQCGFMQDWEEGRTKDEQGADSQGN